MRERKAFVRSPIEVRRPPRTQKVNGRKVQCFKGRGAACRAFAALCAEAAQAQARDREEVRALRQRAAGGDLGAVLDLGLDYGITG